MKNIILIFIITIIFCSSVLADQYVPEFGKMQIMRCEVGETTFNADGSVVSKTNYHRLVRFDDENNKIYIQKEPVANIKKIGDNTFSFATEMITDDSIISSQIQIDRNTLRYVSQSEIVYDNAAFGVYSAKAEGECKILN